MKYFTVSFLLTLFYFSVDTSGSMFNCTDPSRDIGKYVGRSDASYSLVQHNCNITEGPTSWRLGGYVRYGCEKIPRFTAITYLKEKRSNRGPPWREYEVHAAIFDRCEKDGIRVFSQARGHPVANRFYKYGDPNRFMNGNNFQTILKK